MAGNRCSSSVTVEPWKAKTLGRHQFDHLSQRSDGNSDGKNDSWYPFLADLPDVEALGVLTNYPPCLQPLGPGGLHQHGQGFASGCRFGGMAMETGRPAGAGAYFYVVDYTSTCGDSQSGTEGLLHIIRE